MKLMICMNGEPEQLPFLPEIIELGAGIELGSYGLAGVQSEQAWEARLAQHQAVRGRFAGRIAIHGPFIGMEFAHIDHLIREAVKRRLDRTFEAAVKLKTSRVILHSGYTSETEFFKKQAAWVSGNAEFWRIEIQRWAQAGIEIVLENDIEKTPDYLVQLVNEVDHPSLGLCMDIGHQHVFSKMDPVEWVERMGDRLYHIHVHDNDRRADRHWPIGHGTIQFEPFFAALEQHALKATISLEVEDEMVVKLGDLRKLAARFVID
jgi:sugar phosphate isomerase/epimerase